MKDTTRDQSANERKYCWRCIAGDTGLKGNIAAAAAAAEEHIFCCMYALAD